MVEDSGRSERETREGSWTDSATFPNTPAAASTGSSACQCKFLRMSHQCDQRSSSPLSCATPAPIRRVTTVFRNECSGFLPVTPTRCRYVLTHFPTASPTVGRPFAFLGIGNRSDPSTHGSFRYHLARRDTPASSGTVQRGFDLSPFRDITQIDRNHYPTVVVQTPAPRGYQREPL